MKFCTNPLYFYVLLYSLALHFQASFINAEKILVVIMIGSKSHKTAFEPLFEELAARGHDVTVLSSIKPSKQVPNITEVVGYEAKKLTSNLPNAFELRAQGRNLNAFHYAELSENMCRGYFENPQVQNLLKLKFDLIIMNVFLGECAYGLLSHFNTKFIMMSSMPAPTWVSATFGTPTLPSFNSVFFYGYSQRMTFVERMINFVGHIHVHYLRNYYHVPRMEAVYREYLPKAGSVHEIEKQASLMLINSHSSMNPPMLLFPDMIEVGGMHCVDTKTLPKNLQDFLNGAGEDGFIYFSMGSLLQGKSMPEKYRQAFVDAFSKLNQRILWKFEDDEILNLSSNVKIGKWFPQQDILGHPKIKLSITHGGLLSAQEAVYHSVPLLGIPLFSDQDKNMEQAESKGYGLTMELVDITEEYVLEKINLILNDNRFLTNVKTISLAFRDRIQTPLKTAVFWTEYILRQQDGALHLRSAGRDFSFIVYNSIDVILTLFGITCLIVYFIYIPIGFAYRRLIVRVSRTSNSASPVPVKRKHNDKQKLK